MNTYTVVIEREDNQWLAFCVEEPGAMDFGRNLAALRAGMKDAIMLQADLPDDSPIRVVFQAGESLNADERKAIELANEREEITERKRQLDLKVQRTVKDLSDRGYTVRSIAGLVGLTPGRITQLTKV